MNSKQRNVWSSVRRNQILGVKGLRVTEFQFLTASEAPEETC